MRRFWRVGAFRRGNRKWGEEMKVAREGRVEVEEVGGGIGFQGAVGGGVQGAVLESPTGRTGSLARGMT